MAAPLPIRNVDLVRPLRWLALGWRDLRHAPIASIAHGIAVMLVGQFVVVVALEFPALLAGAASGFVLVAPLLATGLYELSRRIAAGRSTSIDDAIAAWRRRVRPQIEFGVLLLVLGSLWVGVSAMLLHWFVPARITDAAAFFRTLVAPDRAAFFLVWVVLGGTGAAIVFAMTAVSAPLLLDRRISLRSAILTSIRAVGENPLPMAFWAGLIMLATLVGTATLMVGFVVLVPVLGHATWHAYQDLVDTSAAPARD